MADNDELATIDRVVAIVGLSKTTIYREIADGRFPRPVIVRRRALWPLSRIREWIRRQVEASPDKNFDVAA